MDKNFDMKSLVKETDFHILQEEGRIYFGQVNGQQRQGRGITVTDREIY